MKMAALPQALVLCLCVACTHARTAANPRQEERAAEKAENEPSDGAKEDSGSEGEKKNSSDSAGAERASGSGDPSARRDGEQKAQQESAAKDDGKDAEDVAPEDIEVSTTPQGLLEPGAMDKVREKLGVGKGESVQRALRKFQRENDLPATGMLDHETVERLGLSPDEIFEQAAR